MFFTPFSPHLFGCTPIGHFTPKYHPDQIFNLLYAGFHPFRDYGYPGNLISPTLTPAKLGCTPLTLDHTLGGVVIKCVVVVVVTGMMSCANRVFIYLSHQIGLTISSSSLLILVTSFYKHLVTSKKVLTTSMKLQIRRKAILAQVKDCIYLKDYHGTNERESTFVRV